MCTFTSERAQVPDARLETHDICVVGQAASPAQRRRVFTLEHETVAHTRGFERTQRELDARHGRVHSGFTTRCAHFVH